MDDSHGAIPHPSPVPSLVPSSVPPSGSTSAAAVARAGAVSPIGKTGSASLEAQRLHAPQEMEQEPTQGAAIVRSELRDPRLDVTGRAKTSLETTGQSDHLGATRFTAAPVDGRRPPMRQVDGQGQRGDSLPPLRTPPPELLTTRDDLVGLLPGMPSKQASASTAGPASGGAEKRPPRIDKAHTTAIAKLDAEAERAASVARIESALSERYLIKRALITVGDVEIGSTEYRLRGDSARVAFTESNLQISTDTNSPAVARSMVDLTQARGWKGLRVSGSEDFRRMVWLEATVRGVKAVGYEPTPAELGIIKRERESRQTSHIEPTSTADVTGSAPPSAKSSARGGSRKAVVAAIEAVLIEKQVPEAKQQVVLAAVREQLVQMARNGDLPKVRVYDRSAARQTSINPLVHELNRQHDRVAPTHIR
jgi:hypothetical protein